MCQKLIGLDVPYDLVSYKPLSGNGLFTGRYLKNTFVANVYSSSVQSAHFILVKCAPNMYLDSTNNVTRHFENIPQFFTEIGFTNKRLKTMLIIFVLKKRLPTVEQLLFKIMSLEVIDSNYKDITKRKCVSDCYNTENLKNATQPE